MPGRTFSNGEYRYGFNGKEQDIDQNSLCALSTIIKQVLEKLESSLNSKSITYDKQEMKVKHFDFLNGFANEFTPQAIIADFISY